MTDATPRDPDHPRRRLRALLLERPEYSEAYSGNAEFRVAVDSIVNLIPAVLKTSYDSAVEAQVARHQAYLLATRAYKGCFEW